MRPPNPFTSATTPGAAIGPSTPSGRSGSGAAETRPEFSPQGASPGRPAAPIPLFIRAGEAIRFRLRSSGLEPVVRLASWAVAALLRHLCGRATDILRSPGQRERRAQQRAARSFERLAWVLGVLKGAFAKAGQFASLHVDVLPSGASALESLQAKVTPIDFRWIQSALEHELGGALGDYFRELDPRPIGAASVAQVHRAVLLDGRPVAVKVQYPWIARSLEADLRWIWVAVRLWARFSGRRLSDERSLFREFARGLRDELDFEREAQVAAEIAHNLEAFPEIVVPEVVPSHSREHVLTMSLHETLPIGDPEALRQRGVDPAGVLRILAKGYAKQVFADGLFHADPHPGNLFVLDEPTAAERPRVVFVDFGLSRRLDPKLRRELRLGIYALLQRDADSFVARMDGLGMIAPGAQEGVREAVGTMFDRLSTSGPGPLGISGGQVLGLKDEAKALLRETPGLQLPSDLLLYAKTLSYLFALGQRLDPGVDLLEISLPYLLQFLAERDSAVPEAAEPVAEPSVAPISDPARSAGVPEGE